MSRLVIVWNVTDNCNGACLFCSYGSNNHPVNPSQALRSTDKDEAVRFGKLLCDYSRKTNREVLVSWLGGEPLLWEPVYELSHVFFNKFGIQLSATTNGIALQAKRIRQLALDCFDEITISLDGPEEFNDWSRNHQGLFQIVKKNIFLLHEEKMRQNKKLRIKVNTILMRGNIRYFEGFCNSLCDWGVEAVSFNQLGGRMRPGFYPENRLLPEQVTIFKSEFLRIKNELFTRGLVVYGNDKYLDWIARTAGNEKGEMQECNPGKAFLTISSDGLVSPCSSTASDYGVHSKELTDWSDIDSLETIFRNKRLKEQSSACGNCRSTQVFGKFESA
ncbi:MAG TPA: hypothetical protein DF296_03535 [Candidatus Margulisbacteria bacterium]|nr:MAG: hypothetical protein A2X42_06310 [Candidatus Margulisbacteria bacterium GWF2_38_17]OGI05640.1 MAG: hypothetical protein A2X41_12880 [Candidatus Margulisbacteria bacterium GWE2_39_32]HCT84253.1 hypothetical protein [Candidatus Margulisiibacteriota bacterium]